MDILTWNINGIRASKVSIKELLDSLNADIICLQETKVTRDLLDESVANVDGYNSYFSFSRKRTGYSGVATYCRNLATPEKAEEGLTGRLARGSDDVGCYGNQTAFTDEELHSLDGEGRAIITQHKIRNSEETSFDLVVINVYCPRADAENRERMEYKLQFYKLLQLRAEALVKAGRHVVVVGDINASHRRIDNCNPGPDFEEHPSRNWLDSFLHAENPEERSPESETSTCRIAGDDGVGDDHDESVNNSELEKDESRSQGVFVDTFRHFHPTREKAFTCWSTVTGARQTNYGTRIDYIFVNRDLFQKIVTGCDIMPEVEGSDHCPVKARLSCQPVASDKLPKLCSSNMPEFAGKQQKLMSFFQKLSPSKVALARKEESERLRPKGKNLSSVAESSKPGLKRAVSDPETRRSYKKPKLYTVESQKGSLKSFFQKKPDEADSRIIDPSSDEKQGFRKSASTSSQCQDSESESFNPGSQEIQTAPSNHEAGGSSEESIDNETKQKKDSSAAWKKLLSGPPPAPLCKGHSEPCLLRTVKKPGPNLGKKFYVCPRPEGHKDNPKARCNTFIWVTKPK